MVDGHRRSGLGLIVWAAAFSVFSPLANGALGAERNPAVGRSTPAVQAPVKTTPRPARGVTAVREKRQVNKVTVSARAIRMPAPVIQPMPTINPADIRAGLVASYKNAVVALNAANDAVTAAEARFQADLRADEPDDVLQKDMFDVGVARLDAASAQTEATQALANAVEDEEITEASVAELNERTGINLAEPTTAASLAFEADALRVR